MLQCDKLTIIRLILVDERKMLVLVVSVLCGWSLQQQQLVSADDVFASSAHLRLLADGERRLTAALRKYIDTERNRLKLLDQLVLIRCLIYSV